MRRNTSPSSPLLDSSTATCTIQSALEFARSRLDAVSMSARLDAEILLAQAIGKNRAFLRAWPDRPLSPAQAKNFRNLVAERENGMPIAYLCGVKEFWSRDFKVSRAVLIPRPETELLVEMALDVLAPGQRFCVLDLGTGSGIIAVSLALERPGIEVLATDFSKDALAIARENAERHEAASIRFLYSDWFEALSPTKYDLIVSNPPYVACDDPHLQQGDLPFEPALALAAGKSGFECLERIAVHAREWLKPGAHLLLEHGFQQAKELGRILEHFGYSEITTRRDLQGHARATQAVWRGSS